MAGSVEVRKSAKGLEVSIQHEIFAKADPKILDGCIESLLRCAAANGCLDGKVSITESCLSAVAKHNEKSGCLASCFGCA